MSITLRIAHETDLPAIVEIYNGSIPSRLATADLEPISVASRLAWFQEHTPERHPLWVAELDGAIVGWLSLSRFHDRPAYRATAELGIYVREGHHRAGIARTLVKHAIASAPKLGLRTLLGLVFDHNTPSLRLLEAFGFVPWGELPDIAELDGIERGVIILGLRVS